MYGARSATLRGDGVLCRARAPRLRRRRSVARRSPRPSRRRSGEPLPCLDVANRPNELLHCRPGTGGAGVVSALARPQALSAAGGWRPESAPSAAATLEWPRRPVSATSAASGAARRPRNQILGAACSCRFARRRVCPQSAFVVGERLDVQSSRRIPRSLHASCRSRQRGDTRCETSRMDSVGAAPSLVSIGDRAPP